MMKRSFLPAMMLAFLPLAGHAQSRQLVSLQVSGMLVSLGGKAFDQFFFGTGFGGEAQLRLNPSNPNWFSIGAGVQLTKHTGSNLGNEQKLTLTGFFLEPRFVIDVRSRVFRPYLAGRLSLLKQSADIDDGTGVLPLKASGIALGGGAGFIARLGPNLSLDAGTAISVGNSGDYTYRDTGASAFDGDPGRTIVLKVGLNIGFGS
jgi:hypothetical protein